MIETYIPLYRKYRPQSFADLVGQQAVSQALGNAIRLGKVAHAYLFCGPRGTGKTSTARILAKSLNCAEGPTVTPCGVCASCEGMVNGQALDVVEFDAASNNGVDDARELIENCQFAPLSGRYKVYIIDEVHMLTTQAFNALLKTLEEPPPNVVFIFATTEAHKVLPTIVSRCQRFDFHRITPVDLVDRLNAVAQAESVSIDPEAITLIARHSRGGLRDALGLLDQVSVLSRGESNRHVTRDDVLLFIGSLAEEALLALGDAMAHHQSDSVLNQIQTMLNQGLEPMQLLREVTHHFRNLLWVKACGTQAPPENLDLPVLYIQGLQQQAQYFETEEIPQILSRLVETERTMRQSPHPALWLEMGLLGITVRESITSLKSLEQRVAQLEQQVVSGATPAARTPRPMTPAVASTPPAVPSLPASQAHATPAAAPAPINPVPAMPSAPSSMVASHSVAPVVAQPSSPSVAVPAPVPNPAVAAPAQALTSVANSSLSPAMAHFEAICNRIASVPTRTLIKQQGHLLKLDHQRAVFGCSSDSWLGRLKAPDKLMHLQKALEKYVGQPMSVEWVLADKDATVKLEDIQGPSAEPATISTPAPMPTQVPAALTSPGPASPVSATPPAVSSPPAPAALPQPQLTAMAMTPEAAPEVPQEALPHEPTQAAPVAPERPVLVLQEESAGMAAEITETSLGTPTAFPEEEPQPAQPTDEPFTLSQFPEPEAPVLVLTELSPQPSVPTGGVPLSQDTTTPVQMPAAPRIPSTMHSGASPEPLDTVDTADLEAAKQYTAALFQGQIL